MPISEESQKRIPEAYASKLNEARARKRMVGERRVVTILFSDVKGSTAMAEGLDPEEWAEIMAEAFQYLITPIYRYEGTVARLMGDAILAFFGAPIAHEDDPERAVLAALDILDGIQPFCAEIGQQYDLDFNIRVGIHTGTVVVGEIGSDLAMEYTAMGDAVNLASRMEQTALPGTIQISEDTHKLVEPLFEFQPLGDIEVKGKTDPVATYKVLNRRASPGSLRGLEGLSSPIVGRNDQMDELMSLIEGVRNGRGAIAMLIGEAGMGKSRMIEEVKVGWMKEKPHPFTWMEARGVSYERDRAYGLFQHAFRKLGEVADNDPTDIAVQRIEAQIQHFPREARRPFQETIELVLALETGSPLEALEEEGYKRRLFATAENAWAAAAEAGPIVLEFDDLHWADSASIELLVHLLQLSDRLPVLFLCAMRPYRDRPGWDVKVAAERDFPHRYTELDVLPLSNQESDELMANLLAITNLTEDWKAAILQKAEGNPFFVEEVIRALIERDILTYDDAKDQWSAQGVVASIDLPDTLQSLLISRIDRLEPDLRRVLQLAAVIGRSFYYRVLENISERNGALKDQLNTLQRFGLIREYARQPELEYTFRHDLTRDAAYETILLRDRRSYHRRVGETLELMFESRREEQADRLAFHFLQGRLPEKAFEYFVIAGDRAAKMYANPEAIAQYDQALGLVDEVGPSDDVLVQIYLSRGRRFELIGRFDEALENYQALEGIGLARGNPRIELASLIPQVTVLSIPNAIINLDKAQPIAERALKLAEDLDDPQAQAKVLWSLMLLHYFGPFDPALARGFGEQSLEIAEQHGLEEERAYALHDLSRVYSDLGMEDEFMSAATSAREYWKQSGKQAMLADILTNLATRLYFWGQVDEAQEMLEEALEISRKIDNAWGEAYASSTLGIILFEKGRIAEGMEAFNRLVQKSEEGSFLGGMFVPIYYMTVMARLGAADEGFRWAQEALPASTDLSQIDDVRNFLGFLHHVLSGELDEARSIENEEESGLGPEDVDPSILPYMYAVSAECSIAFGDYDLALEQSETAIESVATYRVAPIGPHANLQRSKALRRLGRIEEARAALLESVERSRKQQARLTELQSWTELIALEEEAGNMEAVESARLEAAAIARKVADHIDDHALRESFLSLPDIHALLLK